LGVPEITHVEESMVAHAGNAGVAAHVVMLVPCPSSTVGATLKGVPTDPEVPVAPEKLKTGVPGATDNVTTAVPEPAEFDAVIV